MKTKDIQIGTAYAYTPWKHYPSERAVVTGITPAGGITVKTKYNPHLVVRPQTITKTWDEYMEEVRAAKKAKDDSIARMKAHAKRIKNALPSDVYNDFITRSHGFDGRVHNDGSYGTSGRVDIDTMASLLEAAYQKGKEDA